MYPNALPISGQEASHKQERNRREDDPQNESTDYDRGDIVTEQRDEFARKRNLEELPFQEEAPDFRAQEKLKGQRQGIGYLGTEQDDQRIDPEERGERDSGQGVRSDEGNKCDEDADGDSESDFLGRQPFLTDSDEAIPESRNAPYHRVLIYRAIVSIAFSTAPAL